MTLGEFYSWRLTAPVMVETARDDVVFARVHDIRGRGISTLLAIRRRSSPSPSHKKHNELPAGPRLLLRRGRGARARARKSRNTREKPVMSPAEAL
jgi:hypothetical protein